MKKSFIFRFINLILFIFISRIGFAQISDNYYSICNKWDSIFQTQTISADSSGESEYTDYLRWKFFWKDRVYSSDTLKDGSFALIMDALDRYNNNYNYYHRATNQYSNWKFLGPQGFNSSKQIAGLVSAVYVDTINDTTMRTIYVGTNTSGIWKTEDGGSNWVNITDNSGFSIIGINDICGDPQNGDILYIGTGGGCLGRDHGYGIGLLMSKDKGGSWTRLFPNPMWQNPTKALNVRRIKVDPNNSKHLFVIADTMLIRSLDGGLTWRKIFGTTKCIFDPSYDNTNYLYLRDIELKPYDPSVIYISTDHYTPYNKRQAEVWKLWNVFDTNINNISAQRLDISFPKFVTDTLHSIYTERYSIAVTPAEPEAIYVVCSAFQYNIDSIPRQLTIFKFENNQWIKKYNYPILSEFDYFGGCGFYKLELLVSSTNSNIIYVGGNTFDKIVNWRHVDQTPYTWGANGFHADVRFAVFQKGSSISDTLGNQDIIFAGNDGGVSKTVNGIKNWINLNGNGLYLTQFYGIGGSNSNPLWVGGGTQDNSFFRLLVNRWEQTGHADMGNAVVRPSMPQTIYSVSWPDLHLMKSTDLGLTFSSLIGPPDGVWNVNAPVCLNPKADNKVYFGLHDLWRSSDNGSSFTKKTITGANIIAVQAASAMSIAPSDTQTIYMAFSQPKAWNPWYKSRLFITRDGGDTWNEITPPSAHFYGITSIAVSSTNADSVWVGFGGFSEQSAPWNNRVIFRKPGDSTWYDYSIGLPNMPINCLKYKNGSQGGIFAGTDVGVFYTDRDLLDSTWVPINSGLPPCIVTDVEYIDTINVLRASTYGRGIWETDLFPCIYNNNPLIVDSDQTWTNDSIMDRDIDIKPGYTLRIQSKVKFPSEAKIIVEQGAHLIVDGGTLTNYCSNMWKGIEVWGDSSMNQLPMYQGYAEFINNACVENARIAVTACKKDQNGEILWNTTGGFIGASYSTFKNNFKALEFLEYHHNQNCSFSKVSFIESGPYVDRFSKLSDFVSIFKSSGIHFYGCSFENLNLIPHDTSTCYGRGIYSIDGSYNVDRICNSSQTPCTSWAPTTFKGLSYGIKALGTMPVYPISVTYSEFYRNQKGIYIGGLNDIVVTRNTFLFNQLGFGINKDDLYGLYLDNCTGYSVEENSFLKEGLNLRHIGIVVNNSGPEANEIYNNSLHGVTHGILTQKQNRDRSGIYGLCLKCNDYLTTKVDEAMTAPQFSTGLDGVAINQGSPSMPAGNIFSYHPSRTTFDILDTVPSPINYYYNDPNSTTKKVRPTNYTLNVYPAPTNIPYSKESTCPSKIDTNDIQKDLLEIQLNSENRILDSLTTVLNNLVDAGSTVSLNTQVINSAPPDAQQLHQELLSVSPFLSDSVVKSSILQENVLPNEMIRDILVANPASTKSDSVLDKLNQRSVPMPDSLMAEIIKSRDTVCNKEVLNSNICFHAITKSTILSKLVNYFRKDTTSASPEDSIIKLYQNDHTLDSKYKLVAEYLKRENTSSAQNVLQIIPLSFTLSNNDSLVYQGYCNYYNLLIDIKNSNKSVLDLSTNQINALMQLTLNGQEPIQTYARNILIVNNLVSYQEPIYLPDETKSISTLKSYKTSRFIQNKYMKIFPNPSRDYFIIEYNLKHDFGDHPSIKFSVYSNYGELILSKVAEKTQDQILIETKTIISGTYLCSMYINGKIICTDKVIIAK